VFVMRYLLLSYYGSWKLANLVAHTSILPINSRFHAK
jgi:hypothetical protein